jgi:hypothetical protein
MQEFYKELDAAGSHLGVASAGTAAFDGSEPGNGLDLEGQETLPTA